MANTTKKVTKTEKYDGIAWLYPNLPRKKNATNPQIHIEMNEALDRLEADSDAKVVVIASEGGNFSAGQDLQEFFLARQKIARRVEANPKSRQPLALGPSVYVRQADHLDG